MEKKSATRVKPNEEEELSNFTGSELSVSANPDKPHRPSKKEALRDKKRLKIQEDKLAQIEDIQTDNISIKNKSDEDRSTTSQENTRKVVREESQLGQRSTVLMVALINKPAYLSLINSNRIVGRFGHASAIFKRPIIEGSYFLEFRVCEDGKKQIKTSYPSAVRVGVSVYDFNPVYPLGCKESIAYKSTDGSFIRQGNTIGQAEPYGVGDVITVCMRMRAPEKVRKPAQISDGSSVSFYKNGRLVFEFKEMRQVFYSFGASCFNYGSIEIGLKQEPSFVIENSEHYFVALRKKVPYKDLESNKLFKI